MTAAPMNLAQGPGVVGVFSYVDVTVEALRRLREAGWPAVRVFLPAPRHEILAEVEGRRISPVRTFSLVGAVTGTIAGFALASYCGVQMHSFQSLMVGGKPAIAIPAYIVIGFELTVLIGAIATLLGFLLNSGLPNWGRAPGYDAKFSDDRFGIFVPCEAPRAEEVKRLLSVAGAEEVRVEA